MLMTGSEYLESLRDGRKVYVGSELVDDVTAHPAFRQAAQSFAMIYDRKRASENSDLMTVEEDGERFSTYFLMPRTRDDLVRRLETHRGIASWSHGLMGRSPDQFPGFMTGLAMCPDLFDGIGDGLGDNVVDYYKHMRSNDIFAAHTINPPQGLREPDYYKNLGKTTPALHVAGEDDSGITINGVKMLGTSAVFAHETWVGNVQPLSPDRAAEAITCAVPLNAPGVSLWARKPFEKYAQSAVDNPLSGRFDETDSSVLFENVKVPWEKVFVHGNVEMSRAIYFLTPAHVMANHQGNVRFLEKLKLIVGIAHKVVGSNQVGEIPAVRGTLGKLAAMQAALEGMIMGQVASPEELVPGYLSPNRRYTYAGLHWCMTHHSEICDVVRELMGGGPFQMPADASVLDDPALRDKFETYWSVPDQSAEDRMRLMKLGWDLLGSDFAGRHMQYEKFYAGPRFVMDAYSYNTCPWDEFDNIVDDLLAADTDIAVK